MTVAVADYHFIRDEPVVSPGQLDFPPEIVEVLDNLTGEGRRAYIRQLSEAFVVAQHEADFRPVIAVVEAYYRTLLVRRHSRYDQLRKRVSKPPGKLMTVADVRRRLGLSK